MTWPWLQRTLRPQRPRAALAVFLFLSFAHGSPARAELLPGPEIPVGGLYASWLETQRYESEGWLRGMHHRHWVSPAALPRAWGDYYMDELKVLPELGWVLWIRVPRIMTHLSPLVDQTDDYGNLVNASWPGVQRREMLPTDVYLSRLLREGRQKLLLEKASLTRQQVAAEGARGSLIDINIPLSLPKSVERVVGRGEKSNITVTGRESITFSGETQRTNKFVQDESGRGQPLFPRLEMKQELQVKLSGTVGEKVHVEVENNSLAMGDAAHRIRIRYEGDEDEVIKLIEMGDTQLSLPSSGLISYSSSNKGLFGVKMKGNLGPLDFTAIASKQEGELANKTFNNTGQIRQDDLVLDTQFLANQFFYLDLPTLDSGLTVDEGTLLLFVDDHTPYVPGTGQDVEYAGFPFADPEGDGVEDNIPEDTENLEVGSFKRLELGRDYKILLDPQNIFYAVQLNYALRESDVLAVSYVALDSEEGKHPVGTTDITSVLTWDQVNPDELQVGDPDALTLELIKPQIYTPESPTWLYMMRNVYRLGGRNIDYNTLELEIHRQDPALVDPSHPSPSDPPFLRIFGLDQFGQDQLNPPPDNFVDLAWVNPEDGLLFFPWYQPFDPPEPLVCDWTTEIAQGDTTCYSLPEDDRNPSLYAVTHEELQRNAADYNKYVIRFSSSTAASRFNLGAFDILEGSEVVTLDGRTLAKGSDYRIDYFSGEVELIGDAATGLRPDSNVQISYQYRPIFGGGKSNLLGLHGTYNLNKRSKLSSSWLYESKHSGTRRPRLGEESTRNVVGNLLGNFTANPEFLTRAVNWLPRVDTDAQSSVSVSGELAASFPNPNIDGAAFLDDMEGAEDADELGLHRSQWVLASEPLDVIRVPGGADIEVTPGTRASSYYWFHPQNTTFRRDFNLNLPEQEAQESVEVLRVAVPVNLSEEQLEAFPALAPVDAENAAMGDSLWAGLMRSFGGEGLDLSQAEYIEVWLNDSQQEEIFRRGRIHFELGDIDEDYWNPELNVLDTEDRFNTNVFDELDEDTGLDGLYSGNETDTGAAYGNAGDPAGDDYDPAQQAESFGNSYFKVNGTEKNRRLDTEDLDGNGQLSSRNGYFTLDVALDEVPLIDMVDVYADDGQVPDGNKAWRLYRLNLADAREVSDGLSTPDWSRIQDFRFWVEGMNQAGQNPEQPFNFLEIASIKIVGNRWKSHGIQDVATGSTLPPSELALGEDIRVEVINSKDNANFFWPFGEQIDPQTGLPEREQALNFVYENLEPGHQAVIRKDYQSLNLTGYRGISFYVRTDLPTTDHDVFFRVAYDSTNYYEVVHHPEHSEWTEINLLLTDWTDLKLSSTADTVSAVVADAVSPGRQYVIRKVGHPDLNRVGAVYFGVVNGADDEVLTGESWFNDIRVKEVRRDTGYAGKVSGTVNLGGVINLGGNFQETDAEFRGLRATRGSGATTRNWGVTASTSLQNFVPLLGYKLPISGSYSRSTSTPKYEPSSDVELTDAELQDANRTQSITQRVSGTLSRTPSRNWFGRIFLDNFRLGGGISQQRSRGPTTVTLSETVDYNLSYELTQLKERKLRLFRGSALRWVPNSVRLRTNTNRSWSERWSGGVGQRFNRQLPSRLGKMSNSASVQWNFFPSLRTDFSINDARSLEHEKAERHRIAGVELNLGFQTNQGQGLTIDYTLPFVRRFKPKISFRSSYNQSRQAFVAGSGAKKPGTMDLSNDNRIATNYSFTVGKWFEWMGGEHVGKKKKPSQPPGSPPVISPRKLPPRLLVPVDPLRGPDPRMLKRKTRRWFEEETAGPETLTPTEAVADSASAGPDPMVVVWKTLQVLSGLKPLKVDLSRSVRTAYSNVVEKPSLLYRLGFAENPEMPGYDGEELVTRKDADQLDESLDLRVSTGVTIAEKIQVSTGFDWSRSDRRASRVHTTSTNTKWPSFSVDLSGVDEWPIWGDLMDVSSIGFGFSKSSKSSENHGSGIGSRNETTSITPRWGITWRNKMRSNFTGSYNKTLSVSNTQTTKNINMNIAADFSYNLSAPNGLGIPGLRGIRFKSRLDLTTNLNYTRTRNLVIEASGFERELGGGARTLIFSPGARYQFSDKLSGGATLRFSRSARDSSGEVLTSVGLSLNTSFIF